MNPRESGILLHITSLPSKFGIGDLGPSAYQFVDFLKATRQQYWQILPLNPSGTYVGNSPYASYSAFGGNPLLISPEKLLEDGLLMESEISSPPEFSAERVEFKKVIDYKTEMLQFAYDRHMLTGILRPEFEEFQRENLSWLEDYALFVALKQEFDEVYWLEWPPEIRDRQEKTLKEWREKLSARISRAKFYQLLFFRQWHQLKSYAGENAIKIIGDIPIYVSNDSSDVWANPHLFKLDEEKNPTFVSGAPPDYFSETGQRWGSPVYRWDVLKNTNFSWWIQRIAQNLKLFDVVRLDHFRGFVAYWEIPAEEETAVNGTWVDAPAYDFFETVMKQFPNARIIAEDLGLITPDVREVIEHFKFPSMKILQFAFGSDMPTNPYIPHNYERNCIVYTGTHDNNTIQGWYQNEADEATRKRVAEYLGHAVNPDTIHWEMIQLALGSVGIMAVTPMQDVLGLGEEARMNFPQKTEGNWIWRLKPDQITPQIIERLGYFTWFYNRVPKS
ncbi:MAG TPA: 4-alpha-glucanotransferase [Acidobacteriota bacterium]|nr:4-alpha-glucanotransferase [Acidobacteriota bacterium]